MGSRTSELSYEFDKPEQAANFKLHAVVCYNNKSHGIRVERIVHQLAQANEKLTGNVFKTILTANKVKEQIYMQEV